MVGGTERSDGATQGACGSSTTHPAHAHAPPCTSHAGGVRCSFNACQGASPWQLAAISLSLFSLQDAQAVADGSSGATACAPERSLSSTAESALVRDAVMSAMQALKREANGEFGASKVEQRLDFCLPAICEAASSIIRCGRSLLLLVPAVRVQS
jgi:hypothetical protein